MNDAICTFFLKGKSTNGDHILIHNGRKCNSRFQRVEHFLRILTAVLRFFDKIFSCEGFTTNNRKFFCLRRHLFRREERIQSEKVHRARFHVPNQLNFSDINRRHRGIFLRHRKQARLIGNFRAIFLQMI